MGAGFPIGIERAKSALGAISSDLPYDDWWTVLCAAKAAGVEKECVRDWSARSPGYDEQQFEASWRGTSDAGGIGAGTLFAIAQRDWGWDATRAPRGARISAADRERMAAERAARDAEAQKTREGAQAAAAKRAEYIWSHRAAPNGASPYLTRKGVPAIGVRFRQGGVLVVPLRDENGKLWNLQFIQPDGRKVFLKRGRVQACWHWLGGAPAEQFAGVIAVAEGYATASTVHIATGHATAVAFNGANLRAVALCLRQRYPAAGIVICGDDDRHLLNRPKGKNKGRECAMRAATAANGVAVFAPDLQGEEKDFNDVAPRVGLPRIAEHIGAALSGISVVAASNDKQGGGATVERLPSSSVTGNDDFPFFTDETGTYYLGGFSRGKPLPPLKISGPMWVLSHTRDESGSAWTIHVRCLDKAGSPRLFSIPMSMMSGESIEMRKYLMDGGFQIGATSEQKALLSRFLQEHPVRKLGLGVDRVGWYRDCYVTVGETFGGGEEAILFQSQGRAVRSGFCRQGTCRDWIERVGQYCVGNSRMLLTVSISFAAILLKHSGEGNAIFGLYGVTSGGKSTTQNVGASVHGYPEEFKQTWNGTATGFEAVASQHNDSVIVMDELGEVDAKVLAQLIYMFANGIGRQRGDRDAMARPRKTFRILGSSSGEVKAESLIAGAGQTMQGGVELRLLEIPADAGAGHGVFENLHGRKDGAEFAALLEAGFRCNYGAVGHEFVKWAVAEVATLPRRVRAFIENAVGEWLPASATAQEKRAARKFALVAAGGEMASGAGLTGWPAGEATRGVRRCFQDWLDARGGYGGGQDRMMMEAVRAWFAANSEGRFTYWHRANDDRSPRTLNRAGFRRLVNRSGDAIATTPDSDVRDFERQDAETEWYVFVEIFRKEVCSGFDPSAVLRLLDRRGHIRKATTGQFTRTERLPGLGSAQVYRILPSLFADDGQP